MFFLLLICCAYAEIDGHYCITNNGTNDNDQEYRDIEFVTKDVSSSKPEIPCIEADDNGVFNLDASILCSATNWPYNTIKAKPGTKINVIFDVDESTNTNFQCVNGEGLVSYTLTLPAKNKAKTFAFQNCDGKLDVVTVNFRKGVIGGESNIWMQSGQFATPIPYKFTYEVDGETINFGDYMTINMQTNNKYTIDMDIPQIVYKDVKTNIKVDDSFPLPSNIETSDMEIVFKAVEDKSVIVTSMIGQSCYNMTLENDVQVWNCTSVVERTEDDGYVCANEEGYYLFNSSVFDETISKIKIVGEEGHTIAVDFDLQMAAALEISTNGQLESVMLNIPVNEHGITVNFVDCDEKINNVFINFQKSTSNQITAPAMELNAGTNTVKKLPVNVVYDLEESETLVDFTKYRQIKMVESGDYEMKFTEVNGTGLQEVQTNIYLGEATFPLPSAETIKDYDNMVRYEYNFALNSENNVILTVNESVMQFTSGYYFDETTNTYKYSENVEMPNESLIQNKTSLENGRLVFEFPGSKFAVTPNSWASNTIIVQRGHKVIVNLNSGGSSDFYFETEGEGDKVVVDIITYQTSNQYAVTFRGCDGTIEEVNILTKKGDSERSTVYVKTAGSGNTFETPIKYKIAYDLDEHEERIDFTLYAKLVFEQNDDYTMEWVNFPEGVTYSSIPTNIYAVEGFPIISGWTEGEGDDKLTYILDLKESGDFSHVKVMNIMTESATAEYFTGYLKVSEGNYEYSERLTEEAIDGGSLHNMEQKYTFDGEMMSEGEWAKSSVIAGGKTEVNVIFDRGLYSEMDAPVKMYIESAKDVDLSETGVKVTFKQTQIKNDLYIVQSNGEFAKPVKLFFDYDDEEGESLVPGGEVYVKGNLQANRDGFENVKFQLEYKVVDPDYVDFTMYKSIYLQEMHQEMNENGEVTRNGIEIVDIFFGGYYPEFPDDGETYYTNIYANLEPSLCGEQGCPDFPSTFTTKAYQISDTEEIIYTLHLEDTGYPRKFYITSEKRGRQPDGGNGGNGGNNGGNGGNGNTPSNGANTFFICALVLLLTFLF